MYSHVFCLQFVMVFFLIWSFPKCHKPQFQIWPFYLILFNCPGMSSDATLVCDSWPNNNKSRSVFKIKTIIIVTVFCFFLALLPTFSPTFPSQSMVEVLIYHFLRLFFRSFAQNLCIFHFSFSLMSHVMMDRKPCIL